MSAQTDPVTILLVDDEPKNLLALQAVLARPDRNLVSAGSGAEALRWLLREEAAVVLLDVHMPRMDGFETARLIRERDRTRDTPIIFLTAEIKEQAHVVRGYSLGAVDYIVKPFDPDILRSKVAVFVELFKRRQQVQQQALQLRETSTFLNSVLESSSEHAIMALDLDGRFLAWNEGARKLYGFGPDEMIGQRDVFGLYTAEDRAAGRIQTMLETAHNDGKAQSEIDQVHKSSQRFKASVVISHRTDAEDSSIGYVYIAQDITERLRAERERTRLVEEQAARAEAEASEKQFAILAEASGILASSLSSNRTLPGLASLVVLALADVCLIDVVDPETGDVRRVATAQAQTLPADATDVLRQHPPVLRARGLVSDALRTGSPALRPDVSDETLAELAPEAESLNAYKRLAPRSALVVPMRAREKTLGAITLLRIDGARPLTEGDRTFIEELANRAALAIENARLYGEAQRAVQVRDEFLASASHDLKTPLTVIKGQAQVLERRFSRSPDPESKRIAQSLSRINIASTRIARLVDQMLDVAQLQMGRPLQLDRRTTDLVALAREAVSELPDDETIARVHIEPAEPQIVGSWDIGRIERVIGNLLNNALKFSPRGGAVVLRLTRETDDHGDWGVLVVEDHGVGIPAEDVCRVFDRFFRGRNVAGKIHGTGIGLTGVRQIVEQHGGTIFVTSREGEGTTVSVRLPLVPVAPPSEAAALTARA